MAKAVHFVLVVILGILLQDAYPETVEGSGELFDILLSRIESLEANDFANKAKIAKMETEIKNKLTEYELEISSLKLKMNEMESKSERKEAMMLNEMNELKTTMNDCEWASDKQQRVENDETERRLPEPHRIQRRRNNLRQDREVPETDVAFYATHPTNQVHHVGKNQILQFPKAVTNIGNAFNNNTGGFTAPVDGTYVLHATIMGIDTTSHMRAHFDINVVAYSVFFATSYDQSSQMLVINLKAGQTATIKNDYVDTGYYGEHHSTFSGFLLYQTYPSGAIIGK